jgi:Protein of unknown function (DUF2971)
MDTNSDIATEKKVVKPATIFKYEAFSAQSLQNLKAQAIYFGSPLGFNDPYDCALKPRIAEPTTEELEEFRVSYSQRPDVPIEYQNTFKKIDILELKKIVERSAITVLDKHVESFLQTKGVTCFSESNNDLLMWSHYGGRYKGFCLEFFTEFEPFTKMRKVKYSDTMPKINAARALFHDDFDDFLDLFCVKSNSWSYEKEWRCIHDKAGTLFGYDSSALKSIYFGPDIEIHCLEIICLILAGQNSNVKFWRGTRSQEKFEVLFEEFTYTNYLDAKNKGLI